MQVSSYLNLNFDEIPFPERVQLAAEAGVDGIEFFGWDIDLEADEGDTVSVDEEFYGPDIDIGEITREIESNNLDFVYMSGDQPPMTDPNVREAALENIEKSVNLAKKYNCPNVNVKSGPRNPSIDDETQHNAIVETLRQAAPIAEATDVNLLLEPLNTQDAPDQFLNTATESIEILEQVDSPNVQLLFDIYHEQIMCGDLIRTLRDSIDVIGHVHVADVPTRNEPGTGEINYENVLRALSDVGYDGYVGCEFIPTGEPVTALSDVLETVRAIDSA